MSLIQTASQTAGPFFHLGFEHACRDPIVASPADVAVTIRGRVLDGAGDPVPDAVLEIWQPDASGSFDTTGARGFGRICTDDRGEFVIRSIQPGSIDGRQAPHFNVTVLMRGLLRHLSTRVYFSNDAADPVLALVPQERRATLVARPATEPNVFEWDVVLQGANETVFFES